MINKRRQAGLLSVDAAMGLIVLAVLVTVAILWVVNMSNQQSYRIAADKQQTFAEAFSKYLKDNFAVVLANATAKAPVQITVSMLQNTNYLPVGFSDTNAFGQTIIGLARKPNANQLEAIVVTTGGQTIPEIGIRSIAENLGGPGGFISSLSPSVIQGIRGGWQVALSNYAISPGAGHTASALFLMDGDLANDYLYRNAVPGHPEFNTMNTDLNVGGHNISNAVDVRATGAISAETVDVAGETYTGGWFRTRGDTGWYSEKWGGGIYQSDADWVRIFNDKGLSTGGTLSGGRIASSSSINAAGRISTDEYLSIGGLATLNTACSDSKLLAKSSDGSGITLSCKDGIWKSDVDQAVKGWPGYTILPSGITMQFGVSTTVAAGSSAVTTLPYEFPNNFVGVIINVNGATPLGGAPYSALPETNRTFRIYNGGKGTQNYQYWAFGY